MANTHTWREIERRRLEMDLSAEGAAEHLTLSETCARTPALTLADIASKARLVQTLLSPAEMAEDELLRLAINGLVIDLAVLVALASSG